MNNLRVLHVPESVAGNAYTLSLAERRVGLQSRVVSYSRNPFGYGADRFLFDEKDGVLGQERKKWGLVVHALRHYDVVHYNFGRTILDPFVPRALRGEARRYPKLLNLAFDTYQKATGMKDLPLLKRVGKVVFVTYQGNDARLVSYSKSHFPINHFVDEPTEGSSLRDSFTQAKIDYFARYADRIFGLNPDMLHTLPAKARFLPYTAVDLADWRATCDSAGTDALTVLHAPTSRTWKGTRHVVDAANRLQMEGFKFAFRLVEGVPHSRVRAIYEQADLLVDQLLAGWYGGLAVELMALGKPVIAYIREEDLKFIPPAMKADLPIINANPNDIYDVLKRCLMMDRAELRALGMRSRAFVERWHDPIKIATQLKEEAEAVLSERRGRRKPTTQEGQRKTVT